MHKMLEHQIALDKRIADERQIPGTRDVLLQVAMAYAVELGELIEAARTGDMDKTMEEYSDCTHFVLSMWHRLGLTDTFHVDLNHLFEVFHKDALFNKDGNDHLGDILQLFGGLMNMVPDFKFWKRTKKDAPMVDIHSQLHMLTCAHVFMGFGLGMVPSEIRSLYESKNAVNHERQNGGY